MLQEIRPQDRMPWGYQTQEPSCHGGNILAAFEAAIWLADLEGENFIGAGYEITVTHHVDVVASWSTEGRIAQDDVVYCGVLLYHPVINQWVLKETVGPDVAWSIGISEDTAVPDSTRCFLQFRDALERLACGCRHRVQGIVVDPPSLPEKWQQHEDAMTRAWLEEIGEEFN